MEKDAMFPDSPEKKQCAVCGDNALCFNFNAVSCESCKAFFRRNALKEKSFRCAFKNACDINQVTRKFCQCCRLKKCFAVGMKKELIMTDSQKELKRRKVEVNKEMSKQSVEAPKDPIQSPLNQNGSFSIPFVPLCLNDSSSPKAVQENVHSVLVVSLNDPRTTSSTTQTTHDMVDSSVQTDPWFCHCGAKQDQSSTLSLRVINKLSSSHVKLLENLVTANEALEAPMDQELASINGEDFMNWDGTNGDSGHITGIGGSGGSLLDVINLTAVAIRRLIKMCKRIIGFRSLTQSDQVCLLKQSATRMMLLRSVLTYEPDNNTWKIPHSGKAKVSHIELEVLKEARGNLYDAHKEFLRSFDPRATKDRLLIPILTAIALFDPSRNNLVDRDVIMSLQKSYIDLLRCYLEIEYSSSEAEEIFTNLLSKMDDLHRLHEEHIRVYLDVNPSQVEPLLIEIFDLKPH